MDLPKILRFHAHPKNDLPSCPKIPQLVHTYSRNIGYVLKTYSRNIGYVLRIFVIYWEFLKF